MPMPKLLKRFSEKNLTKRSRSASEDPQTLRPRTSDGKRNQDTAVDVPSRSLSYPQPGYNPPLPPKDANKNGLQSFRSESPPTAVPKMDDTISTPASTARRDTPIEPEDVKDEHTSIVTKDSKSITIPVVSPTSPMESDLAESAAAHKETSLIDYSISKESSTDNDSLLDKTWSVLKEAPSEGTPSILKKLEDKVTNVQQMDQNRTIVLTAIETAVKSTVTVQSMEQSVNRCLEGSPAFLKVLDEIGKLHPFVQVAVLAFKAVWTLEMTRRGNDKKVIALYVEMKDMMKVLLQLQNVKDPEVVAPDGITMKARLQELAENTANDIKACANLCDTYTKKKLVVKMLNSTGWEGRLVQYVDLFTKRRIEFQFALTIHTASGVDVANQKIEALRAVNDEINQKMSVMLTLFQRFVTPDQLRIAAFVKKKGGPAACQRDMEVLRELAELEPRSIAATHHSGSRFNSARSNTASKTSLPALLEDLALSIDDSLQENLTVFSRKFDIQQRQLKEELTRVIQRESDRVIGALTSGPHDKILDKDVFELWREMNWRGSVKSRHFVLALRDYFHEKWGFNEILPDHTVEQINDSDGQPPKSALERRQADEWALVYLNVIRLQPVTEAFDDDGSGFVTTAEVNAFTSARPLGWSLPHWIAYWAAGWEQTMGGYVDKIRDIIDKMFSILPNIKKENQGPVNKYLSGMYSGVWTLTKSVNYYQRNYALQARFAPYVEAEESRLRERLEEINYDIDASDTLGLITGPGRLERFLLPIIYLLLKQHFEIFRVAQTRLLDKDELWDAFDTLLWIFDAVIDRVNTLESSFKQQKLDVKQQFKNFAHGLYDYWYDSNTLWAPSEIRSLDIPEFPYNDHLEDSPPNEKVCNYPLDKTDIDYAIYDMHILNPTPQPNQKFSPALNAILGTWNGYNFSPNMFALGMITMVFYPKDSEDNVDEFVASGRCTSTEWSLTGSCKPGDNPNIIEITIFRRFPSRFTPQHWEGQVDMERGTFTGRLKAISDETWDQFHTFFFSRQPQDILCFRPFPKSTLEKDEGRPSLLWRFAMDAVVNQIRQKNWSPSYFSERRKMRKRFIELYIRNEAFGKPLSETEKEELRFINIRLRATDSRYYHSLALHKIRITVEHPGVSCDHCGGKVGGPRVVCLVCQAKDNWNSVDLCEDPECLKAKVTRADLIRPHLPTHDLLKIRRVLHIRHVGSRERSAIQALAKCRKYMDDLKWCQGIDKKECPSCVLCKNKVTIPCWYCVECEENTFICDSCDQRDVIAWVNYQGPHVYHLHDLVRCQILVEDSENTVEDRLTSIEQRMSKIESLLESLVAQQDSSKTVYL